MSPLRDLDNMNAFTYENVCLSNRKSALSNSKTVWRIWIKFDMDFMSLEATLNSRKEVYVLDLGNV